MMTVFSYTALSSAGKSVSGSVPADNRAAAIAAVVGKGLHPVKVEIQGGKGAPAAKANGKASAAKTAGKASAAKTAAGPAGGGEHAAPAASAGLFGSGNRVTQKHIEDFTRELASLLSGGVPLARAMALLKRETKQPGPLALWTQIHSDLVEGNTLADSLAQHPKSFSTIYVAMIRAGEAGGFLDVVLNQIAEFRAREQDLKGKVKAAMVYPIVLGCLAIAVVVFLLTFFIPKFSAIFTQFGGNLPTLTLGILWVSNILRNYGPFVAVGVIILVVLFRKMARTDIGKRRIESALLGTPALGRVIAFFAMVRFCRMLGTLLGAGVPLVAALKVAKEAIGNQTLADTVQFSIDEVQKGESLARALGSAERLFPSTVVEMIAIAEETGRLDKELVRLSIAYESELDRRLRILVSLAEPVLLFTMAGMIGTIVIGMLLPVFKLQELVK